MRKYETALQDFRSLEKRTTRDLDCHVCSANDRVCPIRTPRSSASASIDLYSRSETVSESCGNREPAVGFGLEDDMKPLRLITALAISVGITALSNAAAPSGRNRLFEVDLTEFPRYRLIWLNKLGLTPFDCGRMMVEPAFAPEHSVSVYSRPSNGRSRKYFVTYATVDRNLWQPTDIGRHPRRAEATKVSRVDCEIPASAADLVRQAWIQMLSGS